MIVIIGAGPSGLVAANYLKNEGEPFTLITNKTHGWSEAEMDDLKYNLGQRTMFYDSNLYTFLDNCAISFQEKASLTYLIGVYYNGCMYNYPIQNDINNLSFSNRVRIYFDYLFRNKSLCNSEDYVDVIRGSYGRWLSDKIILPHTWKTIKEDLYSIIYKYYGKKVLPLNIFGKSEEVFEFPNPNNILNQLYLNVKNDIVPGNIYAINVKEKTIFIKDDEGGAASMHYDTLISTIPLNKLHPIVSEYSELLDTLEIAFKSLRWNNLLVISFVIPTELLNTNRKVIYFPERKFPFSKVTIDRKNGHSVVSAEVSFRRNDESLFDSKAYLYKFIENIESKLKDTCLVSKGLFLSYDVSHSIVTPAYIICDENYERSNCFIQNYLEHNKIYNIGRFAEWKPNLRVEHSVKRIEGICENI